MAYVIPVSERLNRVLNELGALSEEAEKPANDIVQDNNKQTLSKDA